VEWTIRELTRRKAKKVVLFIGDSLSLPMMAPSGLVSRGMKHGKYNDLLYMERFENFWVQNPSGVDSIITDSANSTASLNTGHKSSGPLRPPKHFLN
jgi:alkaline phosphatase